MQPRTDQEIIAAFADTKVLVVGDVMLDEYVWGEVRRISPEAPVPIVECSHRTYAPGGAANVAGNVAGLGGRALLGAVVGRDYPSVQLRDLLQQTGVHVEGLFADETRPTTTKTRIVAHNQHVVRVDLEERRPLPAELENSLLQWASAQMSSVGACILSDYDKGAVTPQLAHCFLELARDQGKPVVVDPKGVNYAKYRGATVVTPNVHEAERAANRTIHTADDIPGVVDFLLEELAGSAILLTRGAEGMSLFVEDAAPVHIPTVARSVFDVTGAGDTVVGTLALALAGGAPLEQAARIANRAAGVVVGKIGTARVSRDELLHETPPADA
jgi:D-beta-D-heptose 7-phosphate kinase/D-beta-D-heptose 1-phosphate adenosyltransferase